MLLTDFDSYAGAVYPAQLDSSLFDGHGALTIQGYQKLLSAVAEQDLVGAQIDVPSIVARYGVSWVLLSMSMDIRRAIGRGEKLRARTWHTSKAGFIYRRETGLFDEEDRLIVAAASFFSLLDIKTRRLCMDSAVHAAFSPPGGEELLCASSRPCARGLAFEPVETRGVRPSWIDYLGHVNNARYGELAYDAVSDAERAAFTRLSRLELAFTRELRPGDEALVERADDAGAILIRVSAQPGGAQSFLAKMQFRTVDS